MPSPIISNADFGSGGVGVSNEAAAKALRKLAEALEAGLVQAANISVQGIARPGEPHHTTLVFTYNH